MKGDTNLVRNASTFFLHTGLLLAALIGSTAEADTTITVNSLIDPGTRGDGSCTLREAINNANANADTSRGDCAAGSGSDNINFRVSGTVNLARTLPNITDAHGLTIDATGRSITVSGGGKYQVMVVNPAAKLDLKSLTVVNGYGISSGGLYNGGGTVTVTNSTFRGNSATDNGGGLLNGGGTVTVTNSTFYGNSAASGGGGLYNTGGIVTITNSTFSGNSASSGGGLYNLAGTLELVSSIVANSPNGGDCNNNGGNLDPAGVNLVRDGTCGASSDPAHFITADPLLGPLANNGGPTQTLALKKGSPAIDAVTVGPCPPPATDQRGVKRPQGAHCDIGAYELVQMPSMLIETIMGFFKWDVVTGSFNQEVVNSGLTGIGPGKLAKGRVTALRNQLVTAGNLIDQNQIPQACGQLDASLKRINTGEPITSSQFVAGTTASDLARMIQQLQQELGCNGG